MPRLFNVGSEPVVISWSERAVLPGQPYNFTDQQVAAGVAGQWSEQDPRKPVVRHQTSKAAAEAAQPNPKKE